MPTHDKKMDDYTGKPADYRNDTINHNVVPNSSQNHEGLEHQALIGQMEIENEHEVAATRMKAMGGDAPSAEEIATDRKAPNAQKPEPTDR